MNYKHILTALSLCLASLMALAQYNPTIDVEGDYKPDFIPQERINSFPERVKFRPINGQLIFDTDGVVTSFSPSGVPMEATGWQDSRSTPLYREYLDVALGSWLNAKLDAGYRFLDTGKTLAGVFLKHNSTSLWKPKLSDHSKDLKRELYDETIGIYITHKTDDKGVLEANLKWNIAYFNYYGTLSDPNIYSGYTHFPTQTWNDGRLHINWVPNQEHAFKYYVRADVRYSSFRNFYYPEFSTISGGQLMLKDLKGGRETDISIPLGLAYTIKDVSTWGIDLKGQIIVQCNGNTNYGSYIQGKAPGNYGMLTVIPYYRYDKGNFHARLAPRIDFALNTEVPEVVRYTLYERHEGNVFHISPDVRLNYHMPKFAIDLQVTGETLLNTLGYNHDMDFFCQPIVLNTKPTYTPIDAKLIFGIGPFAGFQAAARIGYRTTLGQRLGGIYQAFLNLYNSNRQGDYAFESSRRISGLSTGITLKWSYGELISLLAEGSFQPRHGNQAYFNGYDMPEFTLHAAIESSPIKALHLNLDYDLRAKRHPLIGISNQYEDDIYPFERIPNWSNLSLKASYDIKENLSVGISLDNLLCRRQYLLTDIPTPGLTAAATLSFHF